MYVAKLIDWTKVPFPLSMGPLSVTKSWGYQQTGQLVINDFVCICTQADVTHIEGEKLGPPSVCMVYEIAVPNYSNIHVHKH